jgi:hypothetical protein
MRCGFDRLAERVRAVIGLELERYKKWYYGPRADRLQSSADLAQLLLNFAEEMDRKPVNPDDVPPAEPEEELRRVKRRKGGAILPTSKIFLSPPGPRVEREQRACPCCGSRAQGDRHGRELAGGISSRPLRTHPSCAQEVCLPGCESNGNNPQMETAAKPETAIDKGMAGPGLLAYIVTSKFSDYLPLYGLEDIFSGKASRSRGPRNRSGAEMWPIWSSRCMS